MLRISLLLLLLVLVGCSSTITSPTSVTVCDAVIDYRDGTADTILGVFHFYEDENYKYLVDTLDIPHRFSSTYEATKFNCFEAKD